MSKSTLKPTDDTIERRWGKKIAARGIYRDPVRSTHGHLVKASGLRWLSFMVMVPLPWAIRRWALPFLTILAPSQHYDDTHRRRHKTLVDWARQGILQVRRWLPNRLIVIVADSGFAAIELIAAVRRHVCFVTRLRLDANLFEEPPARRPGRPGRPAKKGRKLPKLTQVLTDPATTFQETRTHLGVETQRQWSDLAIARTTPALLGLFSLITLWAAEAKGILHARTAAWYAKEDPTFSDAIATVRRIP
jgi:DDE superfamily endonuclease